MSETGKWSGISMHHRSISVRDWGKSLVTICIIRWCACESIYHFVLWKNIICNSAQTIWLSRIVFIASSSCLEPRPLRDCHTMKARVRRKSTENKENRQFCQSSRCPDASTTCPLHCITFNNDGYSKLTVTGVENSYARVGCNPNKMVTS